MTALLYKDIRENIKTGDLLVWKKDKLNSVSNAFLNTVRFFTRSEYAHVGIAVRAFNRVFIVEATLPVVRIYPLSLKDEFYHILMDVEVDDNSINWLLEKVGNDYSICDCMRAYLGFITADDDTWQCAELANCFYKKLGRDYGNAWTPSNLVEATLQEGRTISLIVSAL